MRPMLSTSGIVTNNRETSNVGQSTVYVPPTNTNVVNPPPSSGQTLVAQPIVHQPSWVYGYPTNKIPIGNMNYQHTPIGISYTRIPYPGNAFTPWGKPNWSYMPTMGGIHIHTTGGVVGPPY